MLLGCKGSSTGRVNAGSALFSSARAGGDDIPVKKQGAAVDNSTASYFFCKIKIFYYNSYINLIFKAPFQHFHSKLHQQPGQIAQPYIPD